ncbi:transposase [Streptacidiphilus sp. MAP12-20]
MIQVAYGHPKDRRVDLKQIQAGLGISADGAVPLLATVISGQPACAWTFG